jgi:hypothetical protein
LALPGLPDAHLSLQYILFPGTMQLQLGCAHLLDMTTLPLDLRGGYDFSSRLFLKPAFLCEPLQNGLFAEWPRLVSVKRDLPVAIGHDFEISFDLIRTFAVGLDDDIAHVVLANVFRTRDAR